MNYIQACTKFLEELQRQGASPQNADNLEPIMKKVGTMIASQVDKKEDVDEFTKFFQRATNYVPGRGESVISVISELYEEVKSRKVKGVVSKLEKMGSERYLKQLTSSGSGGKGWLSRLFGG